MADPQKGKAEDDAAGFEALEQDYQGVRHRGQFALWRSATS